MSNNYIPIKSPFDKVLANKQLDRFHMGEELVRIYNHERLKALNMVGRYSIKKVMWLQDKLIEAQKKCNELFPLNTPVSKIAGKEI
jgi:hypothetical protein